MKSEKKNSTSFEWCAAVWCAREIKTQRNGEKGFETTRNGSNQNKMYFHLIFGHFIDTGRILI